MKIPLICLCLFITIVGGYVELCSEPMPTVVWVDDGDTIVLDDGRRIRYIGINAPEIEHGDKKGEPYGQAARTFNEALVLNQSVRLEFDRETRDRYRRVLAYVYLADGTLVNRVMLERGFAYCLFRRPNTRYASVFLSAQRRAISKAAGIWARLKPENKTPYIGNRYSRRFHLPTCPFGRRIQQKNTILFNGRKEAFWTGFAPCKQCMGAQ